MPLYALGELGFIHAKEAEPYRLYQCIECKLPVQARRGKYRPHFYHKEPSPSCHLYSKSEDHHLIQLQLQKLFPEGETKIEEPFLKANRVADFVWEKEQLVFEIQCSNLSPKEAELRIFDYARAGYAVIWLLDDRLFNKKHLKPAESFIRSAQGYYISFGRTHLTPVIYDQFDVVQGAKRLMKGRKLPIDLKAPRRLHNPKWPENLPRAVEQRLPHTTRFFRNDLLDRALQSFRFPSYAFTLSRWRTLEESLPLKKRRPFWKTLLSYYERWILYLLEKQSRT